MTVVTCKACTSEKAFYSATNANDWMYRHYRSEHGEFPGLFAMSDFFVIDGRTLSGDKL